MLASSVVFGAVSRGIKRLASTHEGRNAAGDRGACTASLFFVSAERPEAWVTEHVKRAPFTCQSNGKNANQTLRCFNYVKRAGYTMS